MPRTPTHPDLQGAIVSLVGTGGAMSRAEIARRLGVSAATVTNVTKAMIERGSLTESGTVPSGGGRPATLLDVTQHRRFALGVKITPNHLTLAEVELTGEVSPGWSVDLDMRSPAVLDRIAAIVAERMGDERRLLGIGVALPGFADPANPGVVTAPILGWRTVDLGGMLSRRTDLPVVIDNDVNALAVATRLYGPQPAPDNLLLITIGYGIGCAFTAGGRVFRGARGGAGEFGHIVVDPDGAPCECGLRGCLETLVSDDALVARAVRDGVLPAGATKDDLNRAAEAGDAGARELFAWAGRTLGVAVASLVHVLDPEALVLSGEGVDMWQHWEPGFLPSLRAHLPIHRRDLPVSTQAWSEDIWAHGAASLVFASPLRLAAT